ncbi:MAG: tetratricopeptide repeat protein [Kofleriaceae bacterium]|nr:tetratricopeptide repeat protein [Kofleriaceae bacterium]
MIEATCAACGTVARIAEADLPAGTRFVTCASCKSRVPVPAARATATPAKGMKIPSIPSVIPSIPKPGAAPATGKGDTIDLADLPAPKRNSPLAGADAPSKPVASALASVDLPAPKGAKSPLDLDDVMGGADLPAPKARTDAGLADLPAPKAKPSPLGNLPPSKSKPASPLAGADSPLTDLPAPKAAGLADLPAPKAKPAALADLPTPKAKAAPVDLPAPKRATPVDLPAPKRATPVDLSAPRSAAPGTPLDLSAPKQSTPADLPAPKAAGSTDLPTPKRATPANLPSPKVAGSVDPKAGAPGNLPAPRTATPANLPAPKAGLADLPAPKPGIAGLADLPAPRKQAAPPLPLDGGIDLGPANALDADLDLPTPKPGANNDLPAPKGFFDDLPQPAHARPRTQGDIDLPAPKGFFDDLPQPANPGGGSTDVAPKGFFDDLPQPAKAGGGSTDVAPKGFFDDLPQPAKAGGGSTDVAPKGFFDDLPQPAGASADVAPKGFFDDLPQPAKPGTPSTDVAPKGFFDDLPQPAKSSGGSLFDDLPEPTGAPARDNRDLSFGDIDLGAGTAGGKPLDLDPGPSGGPNAGPDLDLGLPLGQDQQFADLDLSTPTAAPPKRAETANPIKIKTPAKGASPAPIAINIPKQGPELSLDLADDPHAGAGPAAARSTAKAPAKREKPAEITPEAKAAKKRRSKIILGSVLGLALLGSGGFYMYKRHADAQAKADALAEKLDAARKATAKGDWQKASTHARAALEISPQSSQALGLAAESAIAGALDNGMNGPARIVQGRKFLQDGLGTGKITPELERAQAVAFIGANQPDKAIPKLNQLIAREPNDGWLQLYLGWAQLAAGDGTAALAAFDKAGASPAAMSAALYGQGQAKLMTGDVEGARAAFASVLEKSKDNICAQVWLAATLPPAQAAQREADLNAITQRKDIGTADPRCVTQAYTLLGDAARSTGRLDLARDRYGKAIKITALDVGALVGLASVEIQAGKLEVAADAVQKALASNGKDPRALLVSAELSVLQGKLPAARQTLDALAAAKLPQLQQAQLLLVKGKLLEAEGKSDEAVDAYTEAAKLAGDVDLVPTMIAATKLSDLAGKAADPAKAQDYRDRADKLLSALATRAQDDPALSTTLGAAYLQAGDPAKAEPYLRRAVDMRAEDPEAKLQFAKALGKLGRYDEAVQQLNAALAIDSKRLDIALELARVHQLAGHDDQTIAAYDKLLALPDVPPVVRAAAGKFYAKKGLLDRATTQAQAILSVEPENPAGLYLQGEGFIKAGKWEDARKVLAKATDADPDPQYLDALGRAHEGSYAQSKDGKFIESARFAYERATKADPKLFNAWVGQGRMLVEKRDWEPALKALAEAKKLDENNSELQYNMGAAYFGLRNAGAAYKQTAAQWFELALKNKTPELDLVRRAEAASKLSQLYMDLNKPAETIRSLELATKLGEDVERTGHAAPEWLTETYYVLGDQYGDSNKAAKKRAWQRYVDRKPAPSTRLQTAQYELATSLRTY